MIAFVIDLPPYPSPRHRCICIRGRGRAVPDKRKRDGQTYEDWKAQFALLAARRRPRPALTGPVEVEVLAVFDRPKRLLERYKRTGELKCGLGEGLVPHDVKPDADNVEKSVLDALSGWWGDDCQVSDLTIRKRWREVDGRPRVEVSIRPIPLEPPC